MVRMGRTLPPPRSPQQALVGRHPSRVGRQLRQHPVLPRGQLHPAVGQGHPALGVVNGQVAQNVGFRRLGGRPPAQAALILAASSAGEEGLTRSRRPHIEGPGDDLLPSVGGQEDYRRIVTISYIKLQLK